MGLSILITFFVTALIGIPIAFCMGIVSLSSLLTLDQLSLLKLIPQKMITGIDKFPLMAIPLFILAGNIMNKSGITSSLVRFANFLVGRLRGGLALVDVLTAIFFAGITGVGVGEASVLGSIFVPAMQKEGYDTDFSAAVTASASVIGPIIPPSVPFVLYGCTVGVSVGGLFMAGIIPGILLGLSLMITAYLISTKRKYPIIKSQFTMKRFLLAFKDALLALIMPLIIVGGIFTGVFTATEAAAVAVFYSLIVAMMVLKTLSIQDLFSVLVETGISSSIVFMLISTASILGYILTTQQIPQRFAQMMLSVTDNVWLMLLIINGFLLIAGMFMAESPNIILLSPILVPIITNLGIDPLHFGVIMILNLTIGLITPPVGSCLYILCGISKITLEELVRAIMPFMIAEFIILLVCTFVPSISLYLPRLLGF